LAEGGANGSAFGNELGGRWSVFVDLGLDCKTGLGVNAPTYFLNLYWFQLILVLQGKTCFSKNKTKRTPFLQHFQISKVKTIFYKIMTAP